MALLLIGIIYLYSVAVVNPAKPNDMSSLQLRRTEVSKDFYTLKNNWFRKSKSGLYELYVEGAPFERGVINGKLSKELVTRQEDLFNEPITSSLPEKRVP